MKSLAAFGAALALAACVGDGVEFGGVEKAMVQPPATIPCNQANLKLVKQGDLYVPGDIIAFFMISDQRSWLERMKIGFDVNPSGETVNVRYVGPKQALEHATRQKLVRAVTNSIEKSTYAWPDTPRFATGCEYEFTFNWKTVDRAP